MLRYLCLFCVVGVALGQSTDFNTLIDQLLNVLRTKIVEEGKDELPIDKVNYDWSYKVFIFKVYGDVSCSNGKARYLSTIKRTGDAYGELVEDGISIEAYVGLNLMQFLFQSCSVTVKDVISLQESLGGTVGTNSLHIKIHLAGKTARIDELKVRALSNIQLTTGTNIIHRLENSVLNGLVKKFHDTIINSVNKELRQFQGKTYIIPL